MTYDSCHSKRAIAAYAKSNGSDKPSHPRGLPEPMLLALVRGTNGSQWENLAK